MNQVSYTQRNCTDQKKIETFLEQARTGVLGMASGIFPYTVPVNYVWHNGSVYFHGMGSGKKEKILSQNPLVCFTIYKEQGTVTDPVPCHADTAYLSVMIFGKAEKVTDPEEATVALQKVVDKFMPNYYCRPLSCTVFEKYRSAMDGNAVLVYRITPQEMTAKENLVESGELLPLEMDYKKEQI
ncbi:pyridoxamine 5'-phosphate oxidase family protein [Desulfosporosinus sp. OT]|uniref:pyridoxamine 5'-phosphate oxidase family protein n=1 Tax=Desulfosporosinus sp. OT TaxID=913865 RepID=UPI0002239F6B|nr:pyridoxamine 5'-phosphate oxidase family protein [Desulfosporosinus sp. OT]EGW40768.1 pyridoxamine 5'-phosphate oxidase family protein [Desulfosporosinus sp. OT]